MYLLVLVVPIVFMQLFDCIVFGWRKNVAAVAADVAGVGAIAAVAIVAAAAADAAASAARR